MEFVLEFEEAFLGSRSVFAPISSREFTIFLDSVSDLYLFISEKIRTKDYEFDSDPTPQWRRLLKDPRRSILDFWLFSDDNIDDMIAGSLVPLL